VSLPSQKIFLEPSIEFDVYEQPEQELFIRVAGMDVVEFEGNAGKNQDPDIRTLPDPVQAFVVVARYGMFAHPMTSPWLSTAELMDKRVDLAGLKQSWRVKIRNIDYGALLVLANMLQARRLDSIEIRSTAPQQTHPAGAHFTSTAQLAYPAPRHERNITIDYQMPDRTSRERVIELTFTREAKDFAERVYTALDSWAALLMLGGYPGPDQRPYQSAAVAGPAFLLDPETVEIDFPDLFLSDDDSFAAVMNYAEMAHHTICPVKLLYIR
jgi:hypothetical protein